MAIDTDLAHEARIGAVLILQQPGSSERAHSERVLDHFRCPDIFLDFSLAQELSSVSRYFHFDQNVTCYGRTCRRDLDHVATSRYDALNDTVIGDGTVYLPFDPDEVIDNLRLERYSRRSSQQQDSPDLVLPLSSAHNAVDAEADSTIPCAKLAGLQLSPMARRHHR